MTQFIPDDKLLYSRNPFYNPLKRVYDFNSLSDFKSFFQEEIIRINFNLTRSKNGLTYEIPVAFDIETSSWVNEKKEKRANMYIWMLGFNGAVLYGRTWEEAMRAFSLLERYLSLGKNKLIIYVHNLSYEFQFMRHWLEEYFGIKKVFTHKRRRPNYLELENGIIFKCSYFLSNYSLQYLSENLLTRYPISKLVGNLDYSKIRHYKTPLTSKELDYCYNDVRALNSYIQEKIETEGSITNIPLTNTGYVRNECRSRCFFGFSDDEEKQKKTFLDYKSVVSAMRVQTEEEYNQLKRAFAGGFTHCNVNYSNNIITKSRDGLVYHGDFASSYPYNILSKKYPMGKPDFYAEITDGKEFRRLLLEKCCIFDICFEDIFPRVGFENILSKSKCIIDGQCSVNNGRIIFVKGKCYTTITNVDFLNLEKFYVWKNMKVVNLRAYRKDYLPKNLILSVLEFYEKKTTLKGVEGKEIEYMVSKNMINSIFGMMVTDIIRDEIEYEDGEYIIKKIEGMLAEKELQKYNNSYMRFLAYQWGIFITAYARHELFTVIYELGDDYIYSDTDSQFFLNYDSHKDFFTNYNKNVESSLLEMCKHHVISFTKCKPKTKKGKEKLIGVIEFEEPLIRFKSFGAKRYMYQFEDGFVNMTVSGCRKQNAMPYLIAYYNVIDFKSDEYKIICEAYKGDYDARKWVCEQNYDYDEIFENFSSGMLIPANHSGKLTQTYIDGAFTEKLVDFNNEEVIIHEKSSINLSPQPFMTSISEEYEQILRLVTERGGIDEY